MVGKGSCPNRVDPTSTIVLASDPLRIALRSMMLLWWGRPVNENRPERLLRAFFLRRLLMLHAVAWPGRRAR